MLSVQENANTQLLAEHSWAAALPRWAALSKSLGLPTQAPSSSCDGGSHWPDPQRPGLSSLDLTLTITQGYSLLERRM